MNGMKVKRTCEILSVLLAVCFCAAAPAAPAKTTGPAEKAAVGDAREDLRRRHAELRRAIRRSLPAYVFIGGGSGAIISPDGYVITNYHVAGGSKKWRVRTPEGRTWVADLVGTAPATDLALLKIRNARNVPHLPLGDSDALVAGEPVFAIGNPFGMGSLDHTPTVTMGVVGATGMDRRMIADAIITDAPVNPGNSGGPLIDLDGRLVGVNGQISSRFGIRANAGTGYAISSSQIKRLLEALKSAGGAKVDPGSINGARFEQDPRGKVKVRNVLDGTPAAEAGIEEGDVIRSLDGRPVQTVVQLASLAQRYPAGATVPVAVERDGESVALELTLEKREPGALGIAFKQSGGQSLEVGAVVAGGPADIAGVRPGDVILRIAGRRPADRRALSRILPRIAPGQRIALTLRRGDEEVRVRLEAISVSELRRLRKRSGGTEAGSPDDDRKPRE